MFAKHENIQIDKLLLNLLQKHTGYLQQLKKKKAFFQWCNTIANQNNYSEKNIKNPEQTKPSTESK